MLFYNILSFIDVLLDNDIGLTGNHFKWFVLNPGLRHKLTIASSLFSLTRPSVSHSKKSRQCNKYESYFSVDCCFIVAECSGVCHVSWTHF